MLIYVDLDSENKVISWGTSSISTTCIEIEIGDEHPFFTESPFFYSYENGELVKKDETVLKRAKVNKMKELRTKCHNTIMGRFICLINGVEYYFSNDDEAQKNFDKANIAFDKGYMTEIPWTVYTMEGEVTRVLITPDLFGPLYKAHLEHIQNNISKLRDFKQPIVEDATTVEEVFQIVW